MKNQGKDLLLLANKLIKKIPSANNSKGYYKLVFKNKTEK